MEAIKQQSPGRGHEAASRFFLRRLLLLCREMPVTRVAEMTGVVDHRICRVPGDYVEEAVSRLDWSIVFRIGLDETASNRRHKYMTIFVDMDREKRPALFATP